MKTEAPEDVNTNDTPKPTTKRTENKPKKQAKLKNSCIRDPEKFIQKVQPQYQLIR